MFFLKMVKKSVQSRKRYWVALAISTILFLLVISLSYGFAYFQSDRVSGMQRDAAYSLFEGKSAYTFFEEDICSQKIYSDLRDSLHHQSKVMEGLEDKLGKKDSRVLERKKFYSLLLVEHLDYMQSYNEKCEGKIDIILFFYSNTDELGLASSDAGRLLDVVRSRNPQTMIYSFDVNLDSKTIERLKQKYEIESDEVPLIIVNDSEKIYWEYTLMKVESYVSHDA